MINPRSSFMAVTATVMCLFLSACTVTQVVSDLDKAATDAALLAPLIAAIPGVPPSVTTAITLAVGELDCVVQAEDASGHTAAEVALAAATCGLKPLQVSWLIPPGTPTTILNLIAALTTDVSTVLGEITPPSPLPASLKAQAPKKWDVGRTGHHKLASAHTKLLSAKAHLALFHPVPVSPKGTH